MEASEKKEALRKMYLIRAFEEMAEKLYGMGKIHGTMHLSIGMEASATGAVAAQFLTDLGNTIENMEEVP
jgi:TPP-dependent pyruvate/acetoin dehydrogenase alpha subunit